MSDAAWKPVLSFGIDDGELDGLTPQECFVLGFELGQLYELAQTHVGISKPIHSKNVDRIRAVMAKFGRETHLTFMPDDVTESYMQLNVKGEPSYD